MFEQLYILGSRDVVLVLLGAVGVGSHIVDITVVDSHASGFFVVGSSSVIVISVVVISVVVMTVVGMTVVVGGQEGGASFRLAPRIWF